MNSAEIFIVVMVVVVILALWLTAKEKVEDAKEHNDLLADFEHEKTQPKWRIKVTTERGHFYTKKSEPWMYAGRTFKELRTSKQMAERSLAASMERGYFTIIEAGLTLHIPTCNVLSAQIIEYEPSV